MPHSLVDDGSFAIKFGQFRRRKQIQVDPTEWLKPEFDPRYLRK